MGSDGSARRNENTRMKKFALVHIGFEKPTPEIMAAWGQWFESIKDDLVDMGNVGFMGGREISSEGTRDLPMGPQSLTGMSIVRAPSIEDAQAIAQRCPYISSIRVYELRSHGG